MTDIDPKRKKQISGMDGSFEREEQDEPDVPNEEDEGEISNKKLNALQKILGK